MAGGADAAGSLWGFEEARAKLEAAGYDFESFAKKIEAIEPLEYARPDRRERILMVNASRDEVMTRGGTEKLWLALGKPEIVWFDSTHEGSAAYILDIFKLIISHFSRE